jgi:hypothetical protein
VLKGKQMQWKVYIDTQKSELCVKRAVRKDQEEKVLHTTSSGEFFVVVEAHNEEEAHYLGLIQVLKERVRDLESSLQRDRQAHEKLMDEKIALLLQNGKAISTFESIIRSGELTIANTGRRVIGTWFDIAGAKEFHFTSGTNFEPLMEQIKNTPVRNDDCY